MASLFCFDVDAQARHNKAISRDTWSQLLEFETVRYKKDYYILHHHFKIKCLRFIYTCICNQYPFQLHFYLLKLMKWYALCCFPFLHLLNFFFFFSNFILKVAILVCRVMFPGQVRGIFFFLVSYLLLLLFFIFYFIFLFLSLHRLNNLIHTFISISVFLPPTQQRCSTNGNSDYSISFFV